MKALVAIDGSEQSMKAVRWTMDNLGAKAHVTLFSVVPFAQDLLAEMPPNMQDKLKKNALEALAKGKTFFDEKGVSVETFYETGVSPADSIVQTAQDGGFELIVLGSHGIGGLKRTLMGSTASTVAAHAPCSISIVR